ncbi:diphthine methyltransferase isoform X2 [Agrilus planipennis]|uniref:methylated diphthine methylhydrolase n=1 Tax=Agrilus planipennis TaxID=224129 RepID=A0A1W4WGW8_AGRPL|nr:diphthine methyltransferase isoform X1 [Agrilus planipennis]XP_025837035.1 diphthine methyltransferase isoform X2 [Agrilus planipennis]
MCKRLQSEEIEEVVSIVSRPSDEEIALPCPVNYEDKINIKLTPFSKKESNLITTLPPATKIYTLFTEDTTYNADSVEWCPHAPYQHLFVCANYYLYKGENSKESHERLGRIILYSMSPEKGLSILQKIDTAGILDQKWCHIKIRDTILLGVTTAGGALNIYRLQEEDLQLELVFSHEISPEKGQDCLLLSLDWSTGKINSNEPYIICSDSLGQVHRFKLLKNQLTLARTWKAHEFEAWIAAFYYWECNVFFTGGDDSVLLMFDERMGMTPVAKNKRHGAGVTCIHSNSEKEYTIATGSYDSYLRLWDIRNMKCPKGEVEMPGTLWRVKWDPFTKDLLLVACMVGGVHVVNTIDDDFKIVESYYEHKSIAYGADWCYLPEEEVKQYPYAGNRIIASCSFYDNLLCVSRACLCPYCFCYANCMHAK